MNFTTSLLYLLLLYAVLDKNDTLSLTKGLVLACGILLCNCYFGNRCCHNNTITRNSGNVFSTFNNI